MKNSSLAIAHIPSHLAAMMNQDMLLNLPVSLIDPDPDNPRKDWTSDQALQKYVELKSSIEAARVFTPIIVTRKSDGRYQIIEGERRWRASGELGLSDIPCVERVTGTADEFKLQQLIANYFRADLNIVEQAHRVQSLLDEHISRQHLCAVLAWSETRMSKHLSLLKLPDVIQQVAMEGKVTDINTLTALATLSPEDLAVQLAAIDAGTFHAAPVHAQASDIRKQKGTSKPKAALTDPTVLELKRRLEQQLQASIKFKHNVDKQSGSLTIGYSSLDDLHRLVNQFPLSSETHHV